MDRVCQTDSWYASNSSDAGCKTDTDFRILNPSIYIIYIPIYRPPIIHFVYSQSLLVEEAEEFDPGLRTLP